MNDQMRPPGSSSEDPVDHVDRSGHVDIHEPWLRLRDNPIFIAQARRRLRRGHVMPSIIVIGLFGLCAVFFIAFRKMSGRTDWEDLCYLSLGGIGVLIGLLGTMFTATTIANERRTGILDFHRATPTTPLTDTVGYLVGCVSREYVLAAAMVPFAALGVLVGSLSPVSLVLSIVMILLTGFLYNAVGLLAGLSIDNRRGGAGGAIAIVMALQLLASQGEYGGFAAIPVYLTPYPALVSLLTQPGLPLSALGRPMLFFGIPLHPVILTVIMQGSILGFLIWAATRKIHREGAPTFSRVGAVIFFTLLLFLGLGCGWSELVNVIDSSGHRNFWSVLYIPKLYLYITIGIATLLIQSLLPSYLEFVRAFRRARRLGSEDAHWLADGGQVWPLIGVFSTIVTIGLIVIGLALRGPDVLWSGDTWLCVTTVWVFLAFLTAIVEYVRLFKRKTALYTGIFIFFLTLVFPWLLFGIADAAGISQGTSSLFGALSPLFSVIETTEYLGKVWNGRDTGPFTAGTVWLSIGVTVALAGWFFSKSRTLKIDLKSSAPLGEPHV